MASPPQFTVPFSALGLADIGRVGGKNASLGELLRSLVPLGVRVPDGFAVTAAAFSEHLRASQLEEQIYPALERLDVRDVTALAREGQRIRELIRAAPLSAAISEQVRGRREGALAEIGLDSVSVISDALFKVVHALALPVAEPTRSAPALTRGEASALS